MSKDGGFKRVVRQRARETGERYTQARAAMDEAKRVYPVFGHPSARPFEVGVLRKHLEKRYGIRIRIIFYRYLCSHTPDRMCASLVTGFN